MICRPKLAILGLALALAACSKPYSTPVFEVFPSASSGSFQGIAQLAQESPDRTVRVLSTHGMCSHKHRKNWVTRRVNLFGTALAASGEIASWTNLEPQALRHDKSYPAGADDEGVEGRTGLVDPAVRRYTLPIELNDGAKVEFTFFTWGSHYDIHRSLLAYDSTRAGEDGASETAPKRASINHGLKSELLNRCLVDAVAYVGDNGAPLRNQLSQAVCESLGGRGAGSSCSLQGNAAAQTTVLLTESLGSTILFDALASIGDPDLGETLGGLPAIYMVSNQLPLIHRANVPPKADAGLTEAASAPTTSLGQLLGRIDANGFAAQERSGAGRTIVAYSDPNDLFSYRLDPKFLNLGGTSAGTTFVNVLTSNDSTYFNLFENPATAHGGYECNPDVIGMTILGRDAPRSLVSRQQICPE